MLLCQLLMTTLKRLALRGELSLQVSYPLQIHISSLLRLFQLDCRGAAIFGRVFAAFERFPTFQFLLAHCIQLRLKVRLVLTADCLYSHLKFHLLGLGLLFHLSSHPTQITFLASLLLLFLSTCGLEARNLGVSLL